jgi:hypothetical protein
MQPLDSRSVPYLPVSILLNEIRSLPLVSWSQVHDVLAAAERELPQFPAPSREAAAAFVANWFDAPGSDLLVWVPPDWKARAPTSNPKRWENWLCLCDHLWGEVAVMD